MNKQEVIDKIEDKRTDCDDTIWGGAYDEAIDDALAIVRQLDEPEKPKQISKIKEVSNIADGMWMS